MNQYDCVIVQDFTVKHWYIDKEFEHEWLLYGCVVTENLSLYGDYVGIPKHLSFDKDFSISVDEYGYGSTLDSEKEICVSKAQESSSYLTQLEDRGILFNKIEIGSINEVQIDIDSEGFNSAKIYYGNTPLSFEYSLDLEPGLNIVNLEKNQYFTVQNTSGGLINVNFLNIEYEKNAQIVDNFLPTISITTKNGAAISSRTEYVSCNISTIGAEKDMTDLKAQIKLRGNSTANCPKKPYRIKLDKKNSLFGYTKAKNWVLLADYMDGSNMHNYSALMFSKMIKGDSSFSFSPLHVNVKLNDEYIGLYLFGEHIEAKEGRLNIEQDNIWEKDFDDINFYIERDSKTLTDPNEIEGETYFKIPFNDYAVSEYVFALKYPEKEDFEEELEDGTINKHEDEFNEFFNELKDYITEICSKFENYYHDVNEFENLASSVDMESLAEYALVDQVFCETDHKLYSFKMYKTSGNPLKIGPNWDYDACAYGLPYQGTYIQNPFAVGGSYKSLYINEDWGRMLFNDLDHGRPLFKSVWNRISLEELNTFINQQHLEMQSISYSSLENCEKWIENQYYCLFDNQLYYWRHVTNQLPFLNEFYS